MISEDELLGISEFEDTDVREPVNEPLSPTVKRAADALMARRQARECNEQEQEQDQEQAQHFSRVQSGDTFEGDHALRVAQTAALECPGVSLLFGNARHSEEPLLRWDSGFADVAQARAMRPDTLFRIFSMTKPIVAASLLPLVERGQVSLLDPISKWLPEFETSKLRVWRGGKRERLPEGSLPVRVLDVLRHTAGMFYPHAAPGVTDPGLCEEFERSGLHSAASLGEFARRFARVPLCEEPGRRFIYSPATALVACIAEVITGMPYEAYLEEAILAPLGMHDTGFFLQDDQRRRLAKLYSQGSERYVEASQEVFTYEHGSLVYADGGLFSTIEDYARFVRFLASDGMGIVGRPLLRSFLGDSLFADGLSLPKDFLGFESGFGLGMYVHRNRVCGWSGLANTHFWFDARAGRYAILMAQCFPFSWRYQQLLTHRVRRGLARVASK